MDVLYKELAKLEKASSFTSSGTAASSSSKGKAPASIANSLDTLLAQLHELRDRVAAGSPDVQESLVKLPSIVEDRKKEIEDKQKEIYGSLNRYGKALDKKFAQSLPDFGPLFSLEMSQKALEKTIAMHLIRTGQFAAADVLLEETSIDIPPETHAKFVELHNVLTALRCPDVQPALEWCNKNREFLNARDSSLEFCLHRSQFIRLLLVSSPPDPNPAISYARKHFSSLYQTYFREIARLMTCVAFLPLKRLQASPYADLAAPSLHTDLESMFAIEYCASLGMSRQVPLRVVGDIGGGGALARIEKGRKVMRERKSEWSQTDELPIEISISDENRYHSIFTCPVSKEQASTANPPMMMTCGHVIARESLNKLNKGGRVKCPYCPQESNISNALQVHF